MKDHDNEQHVSASERQMQALMTSIQELTWKSAANL